MKDFSSEHESGLFGVKMIETVHIIMMPERRTADSCLRRDPHADVCVKHNIPSVKPAFTHMSNDVYGMHSILKTTSCALPHACIPKDSSN